MEYGVCTCTQQVFQRKPGLQAHMQDPTSRGGGTADTAQRQCTCGSIALACNDVSTRVIEARIFHLALEHGLLLEKVRTFPLLLQPLSQRLQQLRRPVAFGIFLEAAFFV